MPDLGRHYSGVRLHLLNGIDVEVGKCRSPHLRIGGIEAVHGEDGGHAPLAVYRKLLSEVRGPIGIGHGTGGKQKQLAEVTSVQRQTGDFPAGKPLSPASLCRRLCSCITEF